VRQAAQELERTVGDVGGDGAVAVDLLQRARGGDRLGRAGRGIGLGEQDLPLQVAQFDDVAVDDPEVADAGARQGLRAVRAERPDPDDQDRGLLQPLLAVDADPRNPHLAAVAVERGIRPGSFLAARMLHGVDGVARAPFRPWCSSRG